MLIKPTAAAAVLTAAAGVLIVAAACAAPDSAPGPGALSVLRLSATPTLEIGVMEGDEDYTFQDISSVVRTTEGKVVVADAGSSSISVYTAEGAFVRRIGRRGEGPGEFGALSRVYLRGPDSVGALDAWTSRVSMFDTAGAFVRQIPAEDFSSDSVFPLDVWLYGRFWVDGALGDTARARINAAVGRLPQPRGRPGYRYVRVAADGRLWIREPGTSADGMRTWTVASAEGTPEASVEIPARFEPLTIDRDEVLGRWLGDSDVNFVRAYAVTPGSGTRPAPAWLTDPATSPVLDTEDARDFVPSIRGLLRSMASAQEIHYSTHGTYTTAIDSLSAWEPTDDVVVDFMFAGTRGWGAVFSSPRVDRICALTYGFSSPPGWRAGEVSCSPVPSNGVQAK